MTEEEVYEHRGLQSQVLMLFEEMAELQFTICKAQRSFDSKSPSLIAEEMADVELMIAQLKSYWGVEKLVTEIRQRKLERVAAKLGIVGEITEVETRRNVRQTTCSCGYVYEVDLSARPKGIAVTCPKCDVLRVICV